MMDFDNEAEATIFFFKFGSKLDEPIFRKDTIFKWNTEDEKDIRNFLQSVW